MGTGLPMKEGQVYVQDTATGIGKCLGAVQGGFGIRAVVLSKPIAERKLVISEAMSALLKSSGSGAAVVNEPDCDMAAVKLPHVPIVQLV